MALSGPPAGSCSGLASDQGTFPARNRLFPDQTQRLGIWEGEWHRALRRKPPANCRGPFIQGAGFASITSRFTGGSTAVRRPCSSGWPNLTTPESVPRFERRQRRDVCISSDSNLELSAEGSSFYVECVLECVASFPILKGGTIYPRVLRARETSRLGLIVAVLDFFFSLRRSNKS